MTTTTEPLKIGGFEAKPIKSSAPMGVFLTIYGPQGIGKTALAGSAVYSVEWCGRMLYVDVEGGSRSIAHLDGIDVVQISKWDHLEAIMRDVIERANPNKPGDFPYGTIVFDNISELRKALEIKMTGDDPESTLSIRQWGELSRTMLGFVRKCRDISRFFGINIILIAWDTPERTRAKESPGSKEYVMVDNPNVRQLDFNRALAKEFPGIVDVIAYLYLVEGDEAYTRCLSFSPGKETQSKFRRAPTESAMSIPYKIYSADPNHHIMADLFDTLRGGKPFPAKQYAKPA